MHRRLRSSLLLLAFTLPLAAQAPPDPSGDWQGAIELPGQKLDVRLMLRKSEADWRGTIDIPAQGAKALPLKSIAMEGAKVSFAIAEVSGDPTFAGELAADGNSIAGRFVQGGGRFRFRLTRAAAVSFEGIPDFLDGLRRSFRVPGCAVAVVKGGEVVTMLVSGERDLEGHLPVTPDTLFAIGSSTKAFTTLLLGSLVDEGKLSWDQPVRTWLPEFALADAAVGERLTLCDLVTHRSGMPRHDLVWYGATFDRADLVRRLRYLPLNKDLRTDFQYNNLMLLTAGHLAERVTGKTWEDLIRDRILAPLGMARTNFAVTQSVADADHAEPYAYVDKRVVRLPFRDITAIGPAGSINSSVREMARWVSLQLSMGSLDGHEYVRSATMDYLHCVQMPMSSGPLAGEDILAVGYAPGWMVDVYRGARRIAHGGNIDGFSAMVAMLPDKGYGFVVLTNFDKSPMAELVVRRLCDRVLGLADKDYGKAIAQQLDMVGNKAAQAREAESLERVADARPSHPLDDYQGVYVHPGYGELRVGRDGKVLTMDLHGLRATLEPWHYDVFRVGDAAPSSPLEGLKVQFALNVDGDIESLRAPLEPAVPALVFVRKPDAALSDPQVLAQLVGEYDLGGQVLTVAREGSTLVLTLPGQRHRLLGRSAWVFDFDGLLGYSVRFLLGEDGKAKGLRVRQPDGVYVGKRKDAGR